MLNDPKPHTGNTMNASPEPTSFVCECGWEGDDMVHILCGHGPDAYGGTLREMPSA